MATSDKQIQAFVKNVNVKITENANVMYDATIEVDAPEIDTPESEELEEKEELVKAAMSKFNPPVRHTARHDFDSDSETESENDKFLSNLSVEDESPDRKSRVSEKSFELQKQESKESSGRKPKTRRADSTNSETDSGDLDPGLPDPLLGLLPKKPANVVIPAEGAYDPQQFQDLKVPPDMENLFQYILKYTPQKIDIDYKLQPFVPEYIPAVGDIDAFIKLTTPPCNVRGGALNETVLDHIDNLGVCVLDEPAAEQSDSALLHLQLRALSKTTSASSTVMAKKIENAEKNPKAIERWIRDVSELHLSKPAPTLTYTSTSKMPDIDNLMQEWPEKMEEVLNEEGFPPANLDCCLTQYVDLVCAMFDIPVSGNTLSDRIQSLHLLFSLYSAVKNSQLFLEREKEKENALIDK